ELEGIAREVWESTGEMEPVEAFELARRCGLTLRGWMKPEGKREGATLWYPLGARHVRQQGAVRHELSHFVAEDHGLDPHNEEIARYLSGALGLPRRPFLRQLEETDIDLDVLQTLHPHVSGEALIVRATQLLPATAWVWDAGKIARVYGVPSEEAVVAELVDRVLTLEEPCRDGNVRAWPRFDGSWRRVLVVRRAA
ncbi:MAG: hypothetical protein H5U40_04400, partial [Polyangiaceae bacterium]|nr:hypothetical protein [Polyangiaceae bacterium]